MTTGTVPDRLLTVQEAAGILGLQPSTLYTWASERRIPTVKIGRALRICLSTVERLIAEGERPALDALRMSPSRNRRMRREP